MEGIGGVIRKKADEANRAPKKKGAGQLPGMESSEPRKERYMHTEAHALAAEISSYFAERKKFALYLAIIRRLGVQQARTLFAEIKSGDANVASPRKFFMWSARRTTVVPKAPKAKTPRKPKKKPGTKQLDLNDFLG